MCRRENDRIEMREGDRQLQFSLTYGTRGPKYVIVGTSKFGKMTLVTEISQLDFDL
jgi:hypothetical protein